MTRSPGDANEPMSGQRLNYKAKSWSETAKRMNKKEQHLLNGGDCSPFPEYRDPPVREENVVDLDHLDEPPEGFCEQYKWLRNIKYPDAKKGFWLLKFHFWGINQHFPGNHETRIHAFLKLFYNMDPEYRVTTREEFEDTNRDAGPRLLKPEILARVKKPPISRHYEELPLGCDPEQQRLAPAKQSLAQLREAQKKAQEIAQVREDPIIPEQIPRNLDHFLETMERLLIEERYKNLKIYPTKQKVQPLEATIVTGSFNVDHTFTPNPQGIDYSLWGYGPVAVEGDSGWQAACDCIIMAGKFLDVGITKIDVEDKSQVTHMHQELDNAIKIAWTGHGLHYDPPNPLQANFYRDCLERTSLNFCDLVEYSTLLRKQFEITIEEAGFCEDRHKNVTSRTLCRYKNFPELSEEVGINDLLNKAFYPISPESLPVSSVRQDLEESRPRCPIEHCGKHVNPSKACHTMPLRLAIYPSQSKVPQNHTSDSIQFTITNSKGEKEEVFYRWLGGIYSKGEEGFDAPDTRHRVYWTETIRGEKNKSSVRMYDPFQNGFCFMGINPARNGSLIPREWQPSVIFYEIILNPEFQNIELVTGIVEDICHAVRNGVPILLAHKPWKSSKENQGSSGVDSGSDSPPDSPGDDGPRDDGPGGNGLGGYGPGNDGPGGYGLGGQIPNGEQHNAEFAMPTSAAFNNANTSNIADVANFSQTGEGMAALPPNSLDPRVFWLPNTYLATGNQPNQSNTNGFPAQNATYTHHNVPRPSGSAMAPLAGQHFPSGTSYNNGMGGISINTTAQNGYNPTSLNWTGHSSVPNVELNQGHKPGESSRKRTWEDDNHRGNKRRRWG